MRRISTAAVITATSAERPASAARPSRKGAKVPILAGRTDKGDVLTVRIGIDLYSKYRPHRLTAAKLEHAIRAHLGDLKRTGKLTADK